ncbi:hypothetical protein DAI22_04g254950 [Oryza sativa Japonica Group]|nr:hypothetical protein DAI22_04g254950 [Oryza sativa Japonica Group]
MIHVKGRQISCYSIINWMRRMGVRMHKKNGRFHGKLALAYKWSILHRITEGKAFGIKLQGNAIITPFFFWKKDNAIISP